MVMQRSFPRAGAAQEQLGRKALGRGVHTQGNCARAANALRLLQLAAMKITREEAFTVLELSEDADEAQVKTAFKK